MLDNVLHINSFYLKDKLHYFFCIFSNVDNDSYFIPVYKRGVLNQVIDSYEVLSKNAHTESLKFNWESIVTEYKSMLC
jgi:hypothetical protein